MIAAVRKDEEFLADVAAARNDPHRLHVWWLGQSSFLIAHRGRHLLLDPYLSDSLTEKYRGTDTPHVRLTERVVDPAALGFVDVVTASHHHTDHLDGETLRPLFGSSPEPTLVVPAAHVEFATQRAGIGADRVVGLDDGDATEIAGFVIEAVPAAHEQVERDELERMKCLGYVVSSGPFRVYHAGDTVAYPGMAERIGAVDLALLPINGRDPARGVAGNMDAIEAARVAAALPAGLSVPCHYDMFEFNTATPQPFLAACEALDVQVAIPRPGGMISLAPGRPRDG